MFLSKRSFRKCLANSASSTTTFLIRIGCWLIKVYSLFQICSWKAFTKNAAGWTSGDFIQQLIVLSFSTRPSVPLTWPLGCGLFHGRQFGHPLLLGHLCWGHGRSSHHGLYHSSVYPGSLLLPLHHICSSVHWIQELGPKIGIIRLCHFLVVPNFSLVPSLQKAGIFRKFGCAGFNSNRLFLPHFQKCDETK